MRGRFAPLVRCAGLGGTGCRTTPIPLVEPGRLCGDCLYAKRQARRAKLGEQK